MDKGIRGTGGGLCERGKRGKAFFIEILRDAPDCTRRVHGIVEREDERL